MKNYISPFPAAYCTSYFLGVKARVGCTGSTAQVVHVGCSSAEECLPAQIPAKAAGKAAAAKR